ncbi:MAG: hypothetical protein CMJ69_09615 [Planctomycetaceae bacterium]|nr:hypothetical protein [Planctomycetaceae bacterium]
MSAKCHRVKKPAHSSSTPIRLLDCLDPVSHGEGRCSLCRLHDCLVVPSAAVLHQADVSPHLMVILK